MRDGSKYVVTNNSEIPRLMHEDLAAVGYQPREYEGYQDKIVPDRKLQIIQEIAKGRP